MTSKKNLFSALQLSIKILPTSSSSPGSPSTRRSPTKRALHAAFSPVIYVSYPSRQQLADNSPSLLSFPAPLSFCFKSQVGKCKNIVKIKKEKRNFLSLGSVERVSVGWQEQKRARENLRCMLFASEIWKSLECSFFLAQKARRRNFLWIFFLLFLGRAGKPLRRASEVNIFHFPAPVSEVCSLSAKTCVLYYAIILSCWASQAFLFFFTHSPSTHAPTNCTD